MIGKKSSLNIYKQDAESCKTTLTSPLSSKFIKSQKISKKLAGKIGSLAVLLGFFGLFGTSAFAAIGSNLCKDQIPTDGNTHKYTCEYKTSAGKICKGDGTTDSWPSFGGCNGGTVCHRCVCPSGQTWQNGKCAAPVSVALTAAKCLETKQILSGGKCEACPTGKQTTDGTTCVVTTTETPKTECTSPTKKDAFGTCNACVDGYQRNNNKCENCNDPGVCCGVKLNTNVPFVGKCIRTDNTNADGNQTTTTPTDAFPKLMGAMVKILTTVILLICFGGVLVGGVMIASSGGETKRASDGKALIGKVVIAIAVLGASGIILHLINPNFFG